MNIIFYVVVAVLVGIIDYLVGLIIVPRRIMPRKFTGMQGEIFLPVKSLIVTPFGMSPCLAGVAMTINSITFGNPPLTGKGQGILIGIQLMFLFAIAVWLKTKYDDTMYLIQKFYTIKQFKKLSLPTKRQNFWTKFGLMAIGYMTIIAFVVAVIIATPT